MGGRVRADEDDREGKDLAAGDRSFDSSVGTQGDREQGREGISSWTREMPPPHLRDCRNFMIRCWKTGPGQFKFTGTVTPTFQNGKWSVVHKVTSLYTDVGSQGNVKLRKWPEFTSDFTSDDDSFDGSGGSLTVEHSAMLGTFNMNVTFSIPACSLNSDTMKLARHRSAHLDVTTLKQPFGDEEETKRMLQGAWTLDRYQMW